MTVRELEREFILGQKWAVECMKVRVIKDGDVERIDEEFYDCERVEYEVGKTAHCRFYNFTIDYIRCLGDVITICVSEVSEIVDINDQLSEVKGGILAGGDFAQQNTTACPLTSETPFLPIMD